AQDEGACSNLYYETNNTSSNCRNPTPFLNDLGCDQYLEDEVVQVQMIDPPNRFVSCINGAIIYEVRLAGSEPSFEVLYNIELLHRMNGTPGFARLVGIVTNTNRKNLQGYLIDFPRAQWRIDRIALDPSVSWSRRQKWARQLIESVVHLHSQGLVAGMICAYRIPVILSGSDHVHFWYFRNTLAVGRDMGGYYPPEYQHLRKASSTMTEAHCPKLTSKTDIFHLGIMLWALASQRSPLQSLVCTKSDCQKGSLCNNESHSNPTALHPLSEAIPQYYKDVMNSCMAENPEDRPTARELLAKLPAERELEAGQFRVLNIGSFPGNDDLLAQARGVSQNITCSYSLKWFYLSVAGRHWLQLTFEFGRNALSLAFKEDLLKRRLDLFCCLAMANGSATYSQHQLEEEGKHDKVLKTFRCLVADLCQQFSGGHSDGVMSMAAIGFALYRYVMKQSPLNPVFFNRDRLHDGIEVTTAPLGQGVANAVGLAVATKHLNATNSRPGLELLDNVTWCIIGDVDLQEGFALEAVQLVGHWKLDNLAIVCDNNQVTYECSIDVTPFEVLKKAVPAPTVVCQKKECHNYLNSDLGRNQKITSKLMLIFTDFSRSYCQGHRKLSEQKLQTYTQAYPELAHELRLGSAALEPQGRKEWHIQHVFSKQEDSDLTLIGVGSEMAFAVDVRNKLMKEDIKARIVSFPCQRLFEIKTQEYNESVMQYKKRKPVVIVEAYVVSGWERYADAGYSMNSFGKSLPTNTETYKFFNLDGDIIAAKVKAFVDEVRAVGIEALRGDFRELNGGVMGYGWNPL
ncbi:MAG: hypothetical protein Q9167_003726, partial [Letrouitia subvulpina]